MKGLLNFLLSILGVIFLPALLAIAITNIAVAYTELQTGAYAELVLRSGLFLFFGAIAFFFLKKLNARNEPDPR